MKPKRCVTTRLLALGFALLLCLTSMGMTAFAAEEDAATAGDLRLISYNIDGLPIPAFLNGYGHNPWLDARELGQKIRDAGYDLLAVQEDFCNYRWIRSTLGAPYYSYHKGNIPAGDGLDFFSQHPIYHVTRVTWAERYGGITYGAMDEYTPKGFLHAVMELAPGAYVDIYTLHANARDKGEWNTPWDEPTVSGAYRKSDFAQLSAYIQEHSAGRAVIVLGDFNTVLWKVHDGLYDALLAPCGLKDTWAEMYNSGNMVYDGGSWGDETYIQRDRILFRGSDAVNFTVTAAESRDWTTEDGRSLADHASWTATLHYTLEPGEPLDDLEAPRPLPLREKLWGYVENLWHDLGVLAKELLGLIYPR